MQAAEHPTIGHLKEALVQNIPAYSFFRPKFLKRIVSVLH
jgi:hypothetical protein